jgi:hypothetical protein
MLVGSLILSFAISSFAQSNWPQGPGPNGDWSASGPMPPLEFSVRTGKNVMWKTPLPETGQGGIAIHGNYVFVATMAPWDEGLRLSEEEAKVFKHATEGRSVVGKDIDAHCLDARTGEILWTKRITGHVPAIYSYPFSDATSASPVTNGKLVWFTNGAGCVTCFTVDGEWVWQRRFLPTFEGPFNKQFEPFLIEDEFEGKSREVFVHMEPFQGPRGKDAPRWNYLVGLDAATGEELWRSEDALTQYNAPTLQQRQDDWFILHARGGPHAVPERPVGLSRTSLVGANAGKSATRFEDPRGNHEASLQTMAHDAEFAYWVLKEPRERIVLLDAQSLKEVAEVSLSKGVERRLRNPKTGEFETLSAHDLERAVFPARYSAIAAGGYLYFQCYATAWGKPTVGPTYSFGRLNPKTKAVQYLEVPTGVTRSTDGDVFQWRTPQQALALNSKGVEVTGDDRSHWDGWDWIFNGSPTQVNNRIYFTLASGIVYVLDAEAQVFDEQSLLAVNDLGPAGKVWTANSISYANGRLYHRTAAEIICIGIDSGNDAGADTANETE